MSADPKAAKNVDAFGSLNDDDIYVINLRFRTIIEQWGSAGLHARTIKDGGSWWVPLGCAVLTGMQAKGLLT